MEEPLNRSQVAAWVFYDFANSVYPAVITATVYSVYYATYIVGNESGLGDLWWGRVMSVSMLFVALSSPLLGHIADSAGIRKKMLFAYTALCVAAVALLATVDKGMVLRGFMLAVAANIGFEGALVYYNSYLPVIAPPSRRGFVSGLGFGAGYAGSAAGLLMVLPLVAQKRFGLAWLSVSAFFTVFSIPTFLGLPADRSAAKGVLEAAGDAAAGFIEIARDVWRSTALRRFLPAFFLYIDGINTTIYFSAIFASTTLGFTAKDLVYLFLVVQLSALAGALALAKPVDVWGPKRVISMSLLFWTAVAVAAYFVQSKQAFFAIAVLAGSGLGVVQSASRTLMSSLIPAGKEAEHFGFYAFCGKSSSVVGPLLFGAISHGLGGDQRTAILSVAAFYLAGLVLLQRVNTGVK